MHICCVYATTDGEDRDFPKFLRSSGFSNNRSDSASPTAAVDLGWNETAGFSRRGPPLQWAIELGFARKGFSSTAFLLSVGGIVDMGLSFHFPMGAVGAGWMTDKFVIVTG